MCDKLTDRLRYLYITNAYITTGGIVYYLDRLPSNLHTLELNELTCPPLVTAALTHRLPQTLKTLSIHVFSQIYRTILKDLANKMPSGLTRLSVFNNESDKVMYPVTSFIKSLPDTLTDLNIGNFNFKKTGWFSVLNKLPSKLESLSLTSSDLPVHTNKVSLPKLVKSLSLVDFSFDAVKSLVAGTHMLQILKLRRIEGLNTDALCKILPRTLTTLHLDTETYKRLVRNVTRIPSNVTKIVVENYIVSLECIQLLNDHLTNHPPDNPINFFFELTNGYSYYFYTSSEDDSDDSDDEESQISIQLKQRIKEFNSENQSKVYIIKN